MVLTDEDLLDFHLPPGPLGTTPRTLLREYGDLYRSHLLVARWLERHEHTHAVAELAGPIAQAFEDGVRDTLHDVATHLRRGDFLPGGELYKDQ